MLHVHKAPDDVVHSSDSACRNEVWPPDGQRDSQKHTIKARLRAIILKDRHHPTPVILTPIKMPIKESDDYITARGANPWTGQISPSVAGTPHTPETPGEALKIRKTRASPSRQYGSPPAKPRQVDALLHANEGRKLNSASVPVKSNLGFWRNYLLSNDTDMVPSAAGRNLALLSASTSPKNEDRFMVRMPCAQEPQPYAHPGRSSQQIQAFEHYRHKTRRTSGEGYDRRLLQHGEPVGLRVASSDSIPEEMIGPVGSRNPSSTSSDVLTCAATPKIDRIARKPVANLEAAGRLQSPSQPPEALLDAFESSQRQASIEIETHVAKTSTRRAADDHQNSVTHLNQLPRVKIVHPSLAAMPGNVAYQESRTCSLGCQGGICSAKKSADLVSDRQDVFGEISSSRKTSANKPINLEQISTQSYDLITASAMLIWYSLPTVYLMERQMTSLRQCFSKDVTVWQVVLASRDLLALIIQCVTILFILGCLWIVIAIMARALQVIFWPLSMMLQISRVLLRI